MRSHLWRDEWFGRAPRRRLHARPRVGGEGRPPARTAGRGRRTSGDQKKKYRPPLSLQTRGMLAAAFHPSVSLVKQTSLLISEPSLTPLRCARPNPGPQSSPRCDQPTTRLCSFLKSSLRSLHPAACQPRAEAAAR